MNASNMAQLSYWCTHLDLLKRVGHKTIKTQNKTKQKLWLFNFRKVAFYAYVYVYTWARAHLYIFRGAFGG